MWMLLPGLYLGWGIGTNDAANAFGPQVGANIISYRRAIWYTALFSFLGAVLEGFKVFPTMGGVTHLDLSMAFIATLSAGISVNLMSYLGLPVSTSHSIIGSLVGVGFFQQQPINAKILTKVLTSWVTAPLGAGFISYWSYKILGLLLEKKWGDTFLFHRIIHYGSIIAGCYAAYAMGSNNVANAMGPYIAAGLLSPNLGASVGGLCIALGVLTYSKNVIYIVGKKITALDPFSALITILSTAATVHFFTQFGIPVSTSQSIVGAVIGIGLTKGMLAVNQKMLWMIPTGWIISVGVSGGIAFLMSWISTFFNFN